MFILSRHCDGNKVITKLNIIKIKKNCMTTPQMAAEETDIFFEGRGGFGELPHKITALQKLLKKLCQVEPWGNKLR